MSLHFLKMYSKEAKVHVNTKEKQEKQKNQKKQKKYTVVLPITQHVITKDIRLRQLIYLHK